MDQLAIGKIGGSFGVQGWVKVLSFSGETEHFLKLETVLARKEGASLNLRVEDVEAHSDGVVIKFAGYETPEAARVLAGYELWVPRDKAAPCGENEYYFADLVGCLLYSDGKAIGKVITVSEGGNGYLLEITREGYFGSSAADPQSNIVPFGKPFIGEVDIKAKRIELLTPWVLE